MVTSHANVRKKLPCTSVLVRMLLSCFLVFFTFNPTGYCLVVWMFDANSPLSVRVFVTAAAVIAWLVVLRLSLQGMGWFGMAMFALLIAIFFVLDNRFGLLAAMNGFSIVVLVELSLALFLCFGLVYSYWMRQATGQSATVKHPP